MKLAWSAMAPSRSAMNAIGFSLLTYRFRFSSQICAAVAFAYWARLKPTMSDIFCQWRSVNRGQDMTSSTGMLCRNFSISAFTWPENSLAARCSSMRGPMAVSISKKESTMFWQSATRISVRRRLKKSLKSIVSVGFSTPSPNSHSELVEALGPLEQGPHDVHLVAQRHELGQRAHRQLHGLKVQNMNN